MKIKSIKGYEQDLGEYQSISQDSYCGESIMWGFPIEKQLGEEKFRTLECLYKLICDYSPYGSKWFVVTKILSKEDAIKKYGKVTKEERGPRGGFQLIRFGEKNFFSRCVSRSVI